MYVHTYVRTDVQTEGHLGPTLLGWLWRVDLKTKASCGRLLLP